ncbi:MAG: hypothetical protein ABI581_12540, partial [Sediminibacterium sp.]
MSESNLLPVITINCDAWNTETQIFVRNYLGEMIAKDLEYEIMPASLQEIIITDKYLETFTRIAEVYGLKKPLVNESEFVSAAKFCHNKNSINPESTLLLFAGIFDGTNSPADLINDLLLQEIAETVLPEELRDQHTYLPFGPVKETAKVFFSDLF